MEFFYFAKLVFSCVLITILMIEMDSTPLETPRVPKILEGSCNLNATKNPPILTQIVEFLDYMDYK